MSIDNSNRLDSCELGQISKRLLITGEKEIWQYWLHPKYDLYKAKIEGKWVYHDLPKDLARISLGLRKSIALGLSPLIKYRPILNDAKGPFKNLPPPLCVYSTRECRAELGDFLLEFGLGVVYWQSEEATRQLHASIAAEKIHANWLK